MNIESIKTSINNYRLLINKGNRDLLVKLFAQADGIFFEKPTFGKVEEEYLRLYLAEEEGELYGLLTTDYRCPSKWDSTTEVFSAKFNSIAESKYGDYTEYKNPTSPEHPNYISEGTASQRINLWKNRKSTWLLNNISSNTVVRFFEIPTAGFQNNEPNYFSLGQNETTTHIDLMLGNDSGLYDMVRPVPPFPPKTQWPK